MAGAALGNRASGTEKLNGAHRSLLDCVTVTVRSDDPKLKGYCRRSTIVILSNVYSPDIEETRPLLFAALAPLWLLCL